MSEVSVTPGAAVNVDLSDHGAIDAQERGPKGMTPNGTCPAYVGTPLVEYQMADQARASSQSRRR